MVYISADGSIGKSHRRKNPFKYLCDEFLALEPHWKVVALACLAFACRKWLNPNPLAKGKIPAADLNPDEHWKRISKDDTFVRRMTEHLGSSTSRRARVGAESKFMTETDQMEIAFGHVDFGGLDGHVAETGDWSDLKYFQGTRCSTTRSAITAYFCGADIAGNQDTALGNERKPPFVGIKPLAKLISCRHQKGKRTGSHRRSVYRLGIGCNDVMAGYSHAFSIVAQPDGSFFWLQSFIGHYSLPNRMAKVNSDGTPYAHLSLDGLKRPLHMAALAILDMEPKA